MKQLEPKHVTEVLSSDIVIGSDSHSGKSFVLNPQNDNEFIFYVKGTCINRSNDAESLLDEYNKFGQEEQGQAYLTTEQVDEVMKRDILIGFDSSTGKKLTFNPKSNDLTIYVNNEYVDGGQDLEAILDVYNDIS